MSLLLEASAEMNEVDFSILSLEQMFNEIQSWPAADKEKALDLIRKRGDKDRRIWYCSNPGRTCDGQPHEGFDYPHARADQWPPAGTSWLVWLIISGRGSGKTRTGGEWSRKISTKVPQIALIGRRGVDVRNTMVEGPSGLIYACENAGMDYEWAPSKKEFTFANGAKAMGFSAEEPDSLRGPQQGAAWLDEPAHMPLIEDVWSNLEFGLRMPGLKGGAKILCTSTPLPTKWLKGLVAQKGTQTTRVSTYVNLSNLDEGFKQRILEKYEGTRLGRQELDGEILPDVEGALWNSTMIARSSLTMEPETFDRIVIAIDPAGTSNRRSDQTGIVVAGKIGRKFYVLEDWSGKLSPKEWANAAIDASIRWGHATIVAEKNYGGDMVKETILSQCRERDETVRVIVKTASRSKELRAEPVVALYEQGRAYHNDGGDEVEKERAGESRRRLEELEEEMVTWIPGKGDSPNRVDALVWAAQDLMKIQGESSVARAKGKMPSSSSVGTAAGRRAVIGRSNTRHGRRLPR